MNRISLSRNKVKGIYYKATGIKIYRQFMTGVATATGGFIPLISWLGLFIADTGT